MTVDAEVVRLVISLVLTIQLAEQMVVAASVVSHAEHQVQRPHLSTRAQQLVPLKVLLVVVVAAAFEVELRQHSHRASTLADSDPFELHPAETRISSSPSASDWLSKTSSQTSET